METGYPSRVVTDWCLNALTAPEPTSFGAIGGDSVPLDPDRPRA